RPARLDTVVRNLTRVGFEAATIDGRPLRPSDSDPNGAYPKPDGGDFIAEDGEKLFPAEERRPGMVLLSVVTADWVADLHSMAETLRGRGYATEPSSFDVSVWVRWATPEEIAERKRVHAERVAPLLNMLI
uniref:hypothetical protein n=1 Tax=Streptomyces pseudogriseolus TaxID=36817 RepID=UPI003FA0969E